jgi:hypothetical protein
VFIITSTGLGIRIKNMEQLDTREKLWKLESEALKKSEEVNNPYWIMCYKNLAMALSTLDAFMARSSEGIKELTEDNINSQTQTIKLE